jgi:hypothetical protein
MDILASVTTRRDHQMQSKYSASRSPARLSGVVTHGWRIGAIPREGIADGPPIRSAP